MFSSCCAFCSIPFPLRSSNEYNSYGVGVPNFIRVRSRAKPNTADWFKKKKEKIYKLNYDVLRYCFRPVAVTLTAAKLSRLCKWVFSSSFYFYNGLPVNVRCFSFRPFAMLVNRFLHISLQPAILLIGWSLFFFSSFTFGLQQVGSKTTDLEWRVKTWKWVEKGREREVVVGRTEDPHWVFFSFIYSEALTVGFSKVYKEDCSSAFFRSRSGIIHRWTCALHVYVSFTCVQ